MTRSPMPSQARRSYGLAFLVDHGARSIISAASDLRSAARSGSRRAPDPPRFERGGDFASTDQLERDTHVPAVGAGPFFDPGHAAADTQLGHAGVDSDPTPPHGIRRPTCSTN